jgi:hypothetical protein
MQRLYCYVDESGQDTQGKLFLVTAVVTERQYREELEQRLLEIEEISRKRQMKWRPTSFERRLAYLEAIL